jgi:hypothetical protein
VWFSFTCRFITLVKYVLVLQSDIATLIQCDLFLQTEVPTLIQRVFVLQADVPHLSRLLHWDSARPAVRCADGHRSGGQQAVSVRIPQVIMARGR